MVEIQTSGGDTASGSGISADDSPLYYTLVSFKHCLSVALKIFYKPKGYKSERT
jgi:hypothetical protein